MIFPLFALMFFLESIFYSNIKILLKALSTKLQKEKRGQLKVSRFFCLFKHFSQCEYLFRSLYDLKFRENLLWRHSNTHTRAGNLEIFNFCTPFREPRVSPKQWEMKMLMRILSQQRRRRWRRNNFNLICLANHFHRTARALIAVEIVFIIDNSKRRHKTEEKFAIHEIQQLFFLFSSVVDFLCCFFSKKFHFHYWRKEKRNIWIKSFRGWAPRWKSAYRRTIIESQLCISIASRD